MNNIYKNNITDQINVMRASSILSYNIIKKEIWINNYININRVITIRQTNMVPKSCNAFLI